MKKTLSRRTFLRGAGAALALPFLDAMRPSISWAQSRSRPPRFLAYYVPCGIHMPSWTPSEPGVRYALTPILEPLAPFKEKMLVLSGIKNDPAKPDGAGDHAAGTGAFLTAAHCYKTEGANIRNGVSIDQVIAQAIKSDTHRFPSLVFGAEGGGNAGGCDSGYSCAYSRNISWVSDSTPAAKETSPLLAFNRLFGADDAGLTPAQRARQRKYRLKILDVVNEDAKRLKAKLGPTDRRKLDEYLTSVDELDAQIQATAAQECDAGDAPEPPGDVDATLRQWADVIALAVQCDLTPVVSFMLGNGGSNRPYPHLDIAEGHHQLSHHQMNPDNLRKLEKIDIWEMEHFAYLLGKLDAIDEDEGTALDNSVVFMSSEIEDGDTHAHRNLPIIVAGKAGGQIQRGEHIPFRGQPPIANLFIKFAELCGVELDRFGDDGTEPLSFS